MVAGAYDLRRGRVKKETAWATVAERLDEADIVLDKRR